MNPAPLLPSVHLLPPPSFPHPSPIPLSPFPPLVTLPAFLLPPPPPLPPPFPPPQPIFFILILLSPHLRFIHSLFSSPPLPLLILFHILLLLLLSYDLATKPCSFRNALPATSQFVSFNRP